MLLHNITAELQQAWQQTVTVSRLLPSHLWRQHVVNQHPDVSCVTKVTEQHLADFIAINKHQRGKINADNSLDYELDILFNFFDNLASLAEPLRRISKQKSTTINYPN